MRSAKETVEAWVAAFNAHDAVAVADLYGEDAINHQVALSPVEGRAAIQVMFEREFAGSDMHCIVENLLEDGEWAALEWRDRTGFCGCGFFHVVNGLIVRQQGYWDRLRFEEIQSGLN